MRHNDDSPTHRAAGPAADESRIAPLSRAGSFRVAAGDPDVHGFRVLAQDGQTIGQIDEVLVDVEAGMVRYLDVELDADLLASGGSDELDRHVLIPIGFARLPEATAAEDVVVLPGLEAAMVVGLPDYDHGPVTREVEVALLRYLDPGFGPREDEGFYDNDAFDEDAFYGARRGATAADANRPLTEQDDRPVNEDRGVHPAEERLRAQLEEETTVPTRGRY